VDTNSILVERSFKALQEFKFDNLISTFPLDVVVNMIRGRYRSLEEMKN